ncbi:DUF2637 domain-containing protein [Cellulosimicrobium funkei]|uniref:DUF2637 domain-containing protein n=1 Tax=Cellulosimicrobium funkei TaxID=264251 RepID=UPI0037DC5B81
MTTTATPRPTTDARINPDNRLVLAGLLVVLVAVAAASFTLSFTGLSAAAPWAAIPVRLAWLVPVSLEVAMLGYVIAAFVRTHRGQSARLPWTLVWALTTVSSAINAAHAWDAGPKGWQGIVGATLAAGFPFMTLAAAHVVAGVALGRSRTPPPRRTRTPRRRGTRTPRRSPRAPERRRGGDARCGRRARAGCGRRRARTCAARRGHRGDGHRGGRRTPGRCPDDPDGRARTRGRAPRRD